MEGLQDVLFQAWLVPPNFDRVPALCSKFKTLQEVYIKIHITDVY